MAELIGQACIRTATMPTAISAFKVCGILSFIAQIFTEDFVVAEATNVALNAEKEPKAL